MAAYIIMDVSITNPKEYEEYKKLTAGSLAAFNGKFIVRGGKTETLEGSWDPERIVILEFPDAQRAKDWWSSAIYSKAKVIRQKASKTEMIIVEGI